MEKTEGKIQQDALEKEGRVNEIYEKRNGR